MTGPVVTATGYADVADYELRYATTVAPEMHDAVQLRLNDTSTLIRLYLADCADEVEAAYPELLTTLTCARVHEGLQHPPGVTSASVGSTSVSYAGSAPQSVWLSPAETTILDQLMLTCCGPGTDVPGLGELGVGWGGPSTPETPDQLWVLTGPPRRLR